MRVEKTKVAMEKTEVAIIVCCEEDIQEELEWVTEFKKRKTPVVMVINKVDQLSNIENIRSKIYEALNEEPISVSALTKQGVDKIREAMIRKLPEDFDSMSITGDLVSEGDTVLLVMPQDIQAPRGRLILPQVQTLRELLDKKCIVLSCTADKLKEALESFVKPPKLIITDSQVFPLVYENKPAQSMLTSFSVLFASHKGDIEYFVKSAQALSILTEQSKVLIAEACTHVPLSEDIGREKLPRMLRKKVGDGLTIVNVSGNDFPKDLTEFDLIILCGACMFNRKYVMSRVELAKSQQVPMTNYGVAIAYLTNILDKITLNH
jgi:[FeFe] hydrogenase H-cluster maturation GTPase HydF